MVNYYQEGVLTSQISEEDLNKLTQVSSGPAVSIFMDTQRIGIRPRRDQIKLKNLLAQAEKDLLSQGHRPTEVTKLLEPARDLLQNTIFWQYQGEGLAIYLGTGFSAIYRLPFSVKEMVLVSRHFHLKPLLPLFCYHWRFYVLALSQKQARLFRGSPYHLEEVTAVNLPQGMEESVSEEPTKTLSFYSLGRNGKRIFHGHGGLEESLKDRLRQYFQKVDRALNEFLGEEKIPLVLASVEYFLPIYQKANSYPYLLDAVVSGNPDKMKSDKLQAAAWAAVSPHFQQERERDQAEYQKLHGTGQTSNQVSEIIIAALQGRVKTLFAALDQECWGVFDPEKLIVEVRENDPSPGNADLIDTAASLVFRRGQKVHAVNSSQMPDKSPLVAIFHY